MMRYNSLQQGSQEWLDARRALITATDLPDLLGIGWRCEADVADNKTLGTQQPATLRMRMGSLAEPLIAEAYTEKTGKRVRRVHGLRVHPTIEWAAASPDFTVIGERRLMEAKRTASRSRFADGLPQDIEAQVRWQLGVTGFPVADVAALIGDDSLEVFEVEHDAAVFDDLVAVAQDFRARLAAGGPFAESADHIRARYPVDNGTMLPATPDLAELVEMYRSAKAVKVTAEDAEKTAANALRAILRDASGIDGLLTYRKNADSTRTNWPAVAKAYRIRLEEVVIRADMDPSDKQTALDELDAIESIHSETAQGPRVLRLLKEKQND